jgi:hypothetical protein
LNDDVTGREKYAKLKRREREIPLPSRYGRPKMKMTDSLEGIIREAQQTPF